MPTENEDEDLGQEIVLDDAPDEGKGQPTEAQVAEAAERVESGEDELEDYSKSVQRRIKRLTQKYREEERKSEEATRLAQQLLQENQSLKGRMQKLDSGYLSEYGARIEAQVTAARRAYKEAYEAGDSDAMITAQEALSRATGEQDRYALAKRRAEQMQVQQTEYVEQPQYNAQPQYSQPAQQPQPDPKAQTWAEKNDWFGQDEVMTYAAFGVHRKLVEDEGFDPQSDEYYTEIDRRMRAEFPHKFAATKSSMKSQVASAGSSASRTTKQGRRSVKLSPSQIAIAKRLNVPLEEYAKYVKE